MNYTQIISIVAYVACVAIFAVALYFKVKGNVVGAVSELIAMAETTELAGKEKMALVVSQLYNQIPAPFKGILTESTLESIAQWIFDWMRKYANAYIESHKDYPEVDTEIIKDTNMQMAADLVDQLANMGSVGLRSLAVKFGIEVEGMTDEEVIKAVIMACLEKA